MRHTIALLILLFVVIVASAVAVFRPEYVGAVPVILFGLIVVAFLLDLGRRAP